MSSIPIYTQIQWLFMDKCFTRSLPLFVKDAQLVWTNPIAKIRKIDNFILQF